MKWRQIAIVAALWTIPLPYWTAMTFMQARAMGKPVSLGETLAGELIYCYLWVGLTPLILWLSRRFPIDRGRLRNVAVHVAAAEVASLGHRALWLVLARALIPHYRESPFLKQLLSSWAIDFGFVLYWVTLLAAWAIAYYRRYRQEEVRAARLEAELAQAQLDALRMQLHPHFLFNTLHAISALVQEDPEGAERMIARLSELLRASLQSARAQMTSLREELAFVQSYLEIERIRFEDRLKINYRIDAATLDAGVPNLILQPIVENAIRHGIARRPEAGRVEIRSERIHGMLRLQVLDDGSGMIANSREGVGLGNTRARLERLFGSDYRLELANAPGGGMEATLEWPFRKLGSGDGRG
ncbi:MAG: sensor histidine kinase [Bryobacteraceae bacterium]